MGKKNFHRSCLERINLSWFVTTLSSAKTKHLPGILNCRRFDAVCFYGNIMAPIPSRAEIEHAQSFCRCVEFLLVHYWFRNSPPCSTFRIRIFHLYSQINPRMITTAEQALMMDCLKTSFRGSSRPEKTSKISAACSSYSILKLINNSPS